MVVVSAKKGEWASIDASRVFRAGPHALSHVTPRGDSDAIGPRIAPWHLKPPIEGVGQSPVFYRFSIHIASIYIASS